METFTEEELRALGLLPAVQDEDNAVSNFSAEDIQNLGIPMVNTSEAAQVAPAVAPAREQPPADSAVDVAIDDQARQAETPVTYQQWQGMSKAEREAAGLPVSVLGGSNYFNRFGVGLGMNDPETGERIRTLPAPPPVLDGFVDRVVDHGIMQRPVDYSGDGKFKKFSTDLYDDIPYEDALKLYREFYESPYTTRPLLGLGYATQRNPETGETNYITPPSPTLSGGAKTGFFDNAAVGSAQALGNALEIAGAGLEKLGVDGATEFADDLMPGVDTGESFTDALVVEGLPILASSLVGAGLALRATQGANLMVRGTASAVGAETAVASVSSNDMGSLLIGENAMLPILRGVDLEDSEANDVIEARLNLLMDGMLAGGIAVGVIQGSAQIAKFAYVAAAQPLVNTLLRGEKGLEDETINLLLRKLVDETTGLSKADMNDPNVRYQIANRIAEIVADNREVLVPNLTRLSEEIPINLDTISALARGLDGTDQQGIVIAGEGLRRGAIASNSPKTIQAVTEPSNVLDQQTRELLEEVGGDTAADQTGTMANAADALAGSGRREVVDAQGNLDAATRAYEQSSTELVADLANDLELSDEVRRLSQATGTEIDVSRTASREQIRNQIETAYVQMRSTKNSLYAAIEGGPIDTGSLYDVLSNVRLDELSRQSTSLQRTSPLKDIAELFQPQFRDPQGEVISRELVPFDPNNPGVVPPGFNQETRDQVVKRVNDWFARDPDMYNFGFFQNIIRPELSTLASDLFARNDSTAGRVVRQIIKTIDNDMVDFVARTDPRLAEDAIEAKRYYQDEFAPLFRDGKLAGFSDLYDGTVARDINPVDFTSGSRGIIDNTIRSGDAAFIGQFKDLLARSEAGGNVNPLADYMVADAISAAATSLRASGGTDAQLGGFIGQLRQYGEALNENFPARAAELNDFANRVQAAQGNRQQLERLMKDAQERLKTTIDEVSTGELRSFFQREYGGSANPVLRDLATASDPMPAFAAVLASNRNDTISTVTALMNRAASLDPVQRSAVEKGIQTAYMRVFRERFLGRRVESGGSRPVNPARIDMSLDETQSMFRVGDAVFKDTPEVMDAVRTMSEVASGVASSRNASPIAAMSATEFNRQASTATNRIIFATIGPLSRTGTRLRAAMGSFLQTAAPDARAAIILDNIMADPAYFAELARRYNRQPNNPEAEAALIRAMVGASVRPNDMGVDDMVEGAAQIEAEMTGMMGD
jgi:hypothetical protein